MPKQRAAKQSTARKTTAKKTTARAKSRDDEVPAEKKLDDLFDMIDDIGTCMFTTRRSDGYLVSRPMQVQHRAEDGHLWFVTDVETQKLDEIEADRHVNLAFYKDRTREWISLSGEARLTRDRAKIRALYKPDWKAWFGDEGGVRDGGPNDPRLTLIDVEPRTIEYLKVNKPMPLVFFEVAKGIVTGSPPNIGDERSVSSRELIQGARLE